MRRKGGRVAKADGGAYTGMPANYQPGFVQSAFGTGNLQHLQNAGMMASGDTLNRYNDYMAGKFAFDPSGTQAIQATQPQDQQAKTNQQRFNPAAYAAQQQAAAAAAQQPAPLKSTDQTPAGRLIDQLYFNTLGRQPDAAGKQFWLEQLKGGMSADQIQAMMQKAEEGQQRQQDLLWGQQADSMSPVQQQSPYEASQGYFSGPRAPGSMPASMVPSLQQRNADQLRYQMSPQAQAADQAMTDQELAQKKEIMQANQDWQAAEDKRLSEKAALEAEQAAAKAREDEAARIEAERQAADLQRQVLLMMMMSR